MKGLLLKDIYLMKELKKVIVIILAVSMILLFSGKGDNLSFVIGYITILSSMMVLNTLSYDELNNTNSFLMTLPITEKSYVLEKYCFGIVIGGLGWVLAVVITTTNALIVKGNLKWVEWILTCLAFLGLLLILLCIMLPINLKFGGEKGRIILIGGIMTIVLLGGAIKKLFNINQIEGLNKLLHQSWIWIVLVLAIIILFLLSIILSINIMKKKQF